MGRWIDKVVTYGGKKGKGSALRRERRLTLSLACVAGDLAADAVLFWRRSHVKIGSKSRRGFHLSPSRFRRSVREAAFRQESTPGTTILPATQATLSFTPLHDFETPGTANELMRYNCEHHRTLGRSSVTHFHQLPQLGIKQSRTLYTHGRNIALLCFWVKSERKKNAGTRH